VTTPTDKAPTTTTTNGSAALKGFRYWMTWVFAVGLVVLFALSCWILYHLVNSTGVDEVHWHRYVYIFSAWEAIVFTAIGWIFGQEVRRSAAATAINDAKDAKKDAKDAANQAREEAVRGRALAEAINASVAALGGIQGIGEASSETAEYRRSSFH
jgi:type VI protein secretion system component VasK